MIPRPPCSTLFPYTTLFRSISLLPGPLVVLSAEFDHIRHLRGCSHRDSHPARPGQHVVWSGASCRDQFVTDLPREREVGNGAVQVPKLATTEPELDSTPTVFADTH